MKKPSFARLYCAQCGVLWDMPCPVHSKHVQDSPVVPFALASLPGVLDFIRPSSSELPTGVCAKHPIPEQTIFGPIRGVLCPHSDKENFCYSVADAVGTDNPKKHFHMESPNACNWIKFVRAASNLTEHNVAVYASKNEVYLLATKEIARNEELKVVYSQKYAESIGICDSLESNHLQSQENHVCDIACDFAGFNPFMSVLPASFPEDEEIDSELTSFAGNSPMGPESASAGLVNGNDHRLCAPDARNAKIGKRKLEDGHDTPNSAVKKRKTGYEERIKRLQAIVLTNPYQFPRGHKQYTKAWNDAAGLYLQRKLLPAELDRARSTLQNALRIYLLSYATTRAQLGRGDGDPSLQRYMDVLEQASQMEKNRAKVKKGKRTEKDTDSMLYESMPSSLSQPEGDPEASSFSENGSGSGLVSEALERGSNPSVDVEELTTADVQKQKTVRKEKKEKNEKGSKRMKKAVVNAESDGSCHRMEINSAKDGADTLLFVTSIHLGSSLPWILPDENVDMGSIVSNQKPDENSRSGDVITDSPIRGDKVAKKRKQPKSDEKPRQRIPNPPKCIRYKPSMEGIHPCAECLVTFTSQELLDLHILGHNPDAVDSKQNSAAGKCPECGKDFGSLKLLVGHVWEHKKVYQPREQCAHCQQYYTVHCMARHMRAMHPEVGRNADDKEKHVCDKCGKEYPSPRRLISHVQAVHMPKSCLYCAKMYHSWVELGQHILTHRQPDGFHCPNCSVIVPDYRALSRHHKAQHNLASIRTCPICNRMFKNKNRMGHHLLSHSQEFKYICGICGKKYKQQSTMQYHKRWSHGTGLKEKAKEKKGDTGKEYKAPRKRMQYEEFKYKCEECRLGFLTDGRFLRHRMQVHGEVCM